MSRPIQACRAINPTRQVYHGRGRQGGGRERREVPIVVCVAVRGGAMSARRTCSLPVGRSWPGQVYVRCLSWWLVLCAGAGR